MSVGRRRRGASLIGALCACIAVLGLIALTNPASAQIGSDRYSSIVIDAASGNVLSAANPDEPRYPASLTKMMTLYMVFEALRDRRINLYQDVPVSPHSASMEPSKLGLMPSTRISVEQAILGLVTKSANDAASALGELLGGDEDRFGQMMTLRARALGMSRTVFRNASGLPDPNQFSTARDLGLLARHLVQDFPSDYRYFSTPSFVFHGRTIYNHDMMLQRYPGADGLKTGYTEAAGHNLVTSALRGDVRLIGVVLGAASNPERDIHMASLLDQGFERMDVPVFPRREQTVASRLGGLVPSAQAATLPTPPIYRPAALRATLPLPLPPSDPVRPRVAVPRWGASLGLFPTEIAARQAAMAARRFADAGEPRVEPSGPRGHVVWHASLGGMTQVEAQGACAALSRHRMACGMSRPEGGQLASY